MNAPDLTKRPPRSARCRLGGFSVLPRLLDKCRATLAAANGEYHYNCPLDQRFLEFVGIDHERLKTEVAKGNGDGEVLDWILANATHHRTEPEILQWSAWRDGAAPGDHESRDFFNQMHQQYGPNRTDIITWNDLLDLDDHVSFGGKA